MNMRLPVLLLAFLGRYALGQDLAPLDTIECFDNTTILFDYMEAKDPFTFEEYILCPNTEFKLGVIPGPSATCCVDGMAPIAARANSVVKCGADGKVSNNCVMVGGQFQVLSTFFSFFEYSNNVGFEGITFKGANFAAILLENDGDIYFKDCLVKVCTLKPVVGKRG